MKIGIVGAGAMARVIASHAVHAGHEVMLSNSRGPKSLNWLATQIEATSGTVTEAADFGELLVLAIPFGAFRSVPSGLLSGKVILDLLNYFPHRDGQFIELQGEVTTSELVARHFRDSTIVKAFNAITADDLLRDARPANWSVRRALPIAGDDAGAKELATRFVDDVGFDAVDVGQLSLGWKIERYRPVYCVSMDRAMLVEELSRTTRESWVPDGHWLQHRPLNL